MIFDILFATFIAGLVVMLLWFRLLAKNFKRRRERIEAHVGIHPALKPKDRVRILIPLPEYNLAAGATGRIRFIFPGDDIEYFVILDGSERTVVFTDAELWQLERVA
jgi:hypothetical protein